MSKAVGLGQRLATATGTFIAESKPKLATFMTYAKVELAPPTPGEVVEGIKGLTRVINNGRKGKFMQLTTKEAWLNTLIGIEVICWFFVGECIGKGGVSGYKV